MKIGRDVKIDPNLTLVQFSLIVCNNFLLNTSVEASPRYCIRKYTILAVRSAVLWDLALTAL